MADALDDICLAGFNFQHITTLDDPYIFATGLVRVLQCDIGHLTSEMFCSAASIVFSLNDEQLVSFSQMPVLIDFKLSVSCPLSHQKWLLLVFVLASRAFRRELNDFVLLSLPSKHDHGQVLEIPVNGVHDLLGLLFLAASSTWASLLIADSCPFHILLKY